MPLDCRALAATARTAGSNVTVVRALLPVPPTLFTAGVNVVAVQLHLADTSRFANAMFDGALNLTMFSTPTVTLAPATQAWAWAYPPDCKPLANANWASPEYVEGAEWRRGAAPLGVRNDQVTTSFNKSLYMTTAYMRTTVQVRARNVGQARSGGPAVRELCC